MFPSRQLACLSSASSGLLSLGMERWASEYKRHYLFLCSDMCVCIYTVVTGMKHKSGLTKVCLGVL